VIASSFGRLRRNIRWIQVSFAGQKGPTDTFTGWQEYHRFQTKDCFCPVSGAPQTKRLATLLVRTAASQLPIFADRAEQHREIVKQFIGNVREWRSLRQKSRVDNQGGNTANPRCAGCAVFRPRVPANTDHVICDVSAAVDVGTAGAQRSDSRRT
jgi:hypothetical protein